MKYLSKKCIFCVAVFAISHFEALSVEVIAEGQSEVNQEKFSGIPDGGGGNASRILSRKRRFLQFPEGSSFQVVYDQTIPIVGSTLLFTVGVTVAMAWQLPSISLIEITKMLREQALNGSHISRMDENANHTTLIDTSTSNYDKYNKHSYYYTGSNDKSSSSGTKNILSYYYNTQQQQQSQTGTSNRINYYTSGNDNNLGAYDKYQTKWQQQQPGGGFSSFPQNFLSPYNRTRSDWSSLVNRYLQEWIRRHPPNYQFSKRRIYPVFGKRSIDEHTHPEDKFFLHHHRSTRHDLYGKIEKFLDAKGKYGHHCVLRALCESGQRRENSATPDSFLREILKAVFSLPSTHEVPTHYIHRTYDEAHAHTGDCAERYSYCKDSIWSENFNF